MAEDTREGGMPAGSVLIVDDEAAQLAALCNTLRGQGYTTVGASSGPDALSALCRQSFDLLLTDLKMPGPDLQGDETGRLSPIDDPLGAETFVTPLPGRVIAQVGA